MPDIEYSQADLISAFLEKRLSDNLDAFKKYSPDIYSEFSNYKEKRFFVIYDADGNINVLDRESGRLLYGSNPVAETINNYEEYKKSPLHKPFFTVFKDSAVCKTNPVHTSLMRSLGDVQVSLIRKSMEDSISYLSKSDESNQSFSDVSYGVLPEKIGRLFWFSTGLGFDLEKMYKENRVSDLYLIEPNKDIFFASMQMIDWAYILDKMNKLGLSIYIGLSDDVDELVDDLTIEVYKGGRHRVAGSFIYSAFYLDGYDKIFEKVKNQIDLKFFSGYGFYDDARLSIAHTVGNFKNGVPCLRSDVSKIKDFGQRDWPVFVIGNGPSLDSDIEFIKNHSSDVIIVSCGSALSTLYKNQIKPNIHVELERTADVVTFIKSNYDDSEDFSIYLKDVFFIGASQVHPDAFSLFDSKGQMLKDVEAGSLMMHKIFGAEGVSLIGRIAPSCVHIGFTSAILLGFRNIFFFGVDMGYVDREYHHSKSSLYEKMNDESKKTWTPKAAGEIEFDSNFGEGQVYSSGYLPMFKNELETIIISWKNTFPDSISVLNCSDGAKIEGADPIRSSDIIFSDFGKVDAQVLSKILNSYFSFIPEDIDAVSSELNRCFDKIDEMVVWLKSKIFHAHTIEDAEKIIKNISYDFHSDDFDISKDDYWLYAIFDGTLLYSISAINSILYFPVGESYKVESFNDAMKEFDLFLDNLKSDFRHNCLKTDNEENYNYF